MPIRAAAKPRQRVLAHRLDGDAVDRRPRRCPAAPARPWSSAASICPSRTAPTRPTASPCVDCQIDLAQDMHPGRAFAEAQVDVAQFDRRSRHRERSFGRRTPHMGIFAPASRFSPLALGGGARPRRAPAEARAAARRRARRQPDRRLRAAAGRGVSRRPAARAEGARLGRRGRQRRRLRRDRRRRARALRLERAGGHRRADRRTRRQRHAARPRPRRAPRRRWRRSSPRRATRHIATLLAGMRAAPNLGADYQRSASTRSIPICAKNFGVALYPFFLDGGRSAIPSSIRATDCTRRAKAWRRSSPRSCRRSKASLAEVKP